MMGTEQTYILTLNTYIRRGTKEATEETSQAYQQLNQPVCFPCPQFCHVSILTLHCLYKWGGKTPKKNQQQPATRINTKIARAKQALQVIVTISFHSSFCSSC